MQNINYTPEEIAAMHDRNENFHGTNANYEKLQLYQAVKCDLIEFMESCEAMKQVDGFAPNIREKHAIIWMDLSPAASLSKEETAALTEIMNKAGGVVISAVENHVRITYDIKNIWND